ncbi:hypothetical protein M8J75_005546 [Diaphorina citri]|nr:hypothetical protein M8J75_005546 [Diaphorina citri]
MKLEACRREKPPSKWSVLCSCHFVDGNSKTVPSIFPHNVDKKFEIHFPPPEKRRKRSKPELASEEPTRELSPQPGPSSQTTGTSWLPTSSRDVLETEIYFLNKELAELISKKKARKELVVATALPDGARQEQAESVGLMLLNPCKRIATLWLQTGCAPLAHVQLVWSIP